MSNLLSGRSSLAYQGTNAQNPPNLRYATQDPTSYDSSNVSLGDLWLNTENETVWLLVSLYGTGTSGGSIATWTQLGIITTNLETLTGDSGGAIDPDSSNTIFVKGDGTTIKVMGDNTTHTLTASLVSGSYISSLTGNSGGAVNPDGSGNIHVVGDGTTISIVGDPDTHTLEVSVISAVSITLTGNSGGAISPSGGNINVVGDGTTIDIKGDPDTNTLTASILSGGSILSLTGDNDTVHVTPDGGGTINIVGTPGFVSVTGNNAIHTLTIDVDDSIATLYDADIGSATPSGNTLFVAGGLNINTVGSGDTLTINLDTSVTGLTSLTTDALDVTTSATMSFMNSGVVQSDSSGHLSSSKGTDGQVLISSSSGAPVWSTLTAGSNISITNGSNSITISATGGAGSSGLILIDSKDATGLSNVAFTSGISSTYKTYLLVVDKLVIPSGMASFGVLAVAFSFDGGSTYPTTNYSTGVNYSLYNSSAISNYNNSATGTNYIWVAPVFNGLGTSQYISFTAYLYDITTGNWAKNVYGQFSNYTGSTLYSGQGVGTYTGGSYVSSSNPPVDALKIIPVGVGGFTTFSAGTVELYGFVD